MKLFLKNHDYVFAIEQSIFAYLPGVPVATNQNLEVGEDYILSILSPHHGTAILNHQGHFYSHTVPFSPGQEQFALKTAVFLCIQEILPHSPPWGSLTGVRPVKLATKILEQGENVAETLEKQYFVEPIRAKLAQHCAQIAKKQKKQCHERFSAYISIPFCPSRCDYCSFFSEIAQESQIEAYLQALIQELQAFPGENITSLYIGGGTPTTLTAPQLERLLKQIRKTFPKISEFTLEAGRPETITDEKLKIAQDQGVHRLSINPQSFHQETLDQIGRNHTIRELEQALSLACGKFSINMDLIAGIDSESEFLYSVDCVLGFSPSDITIHSFTPKKNTPLGQNISSENTPGHFGSDTTSWHKAMNQVLGKMETFGYSPYYLYRQKQITQGLENIGFTSGKPCHYNLAMMEEFQSIVGFGAGAVSKFYDPTNSQSKEIRRFVAPKFPRDYQKDIHNITDKKLKLLQIV